MNTSRLNAKEKEVYKKVKKIYSEVLDVYAFGDFVEVTVREGGDVRQMRYYDNGMVTER